MADRADPIHAMVRRYAIVDLAAAPALLALVDDLVRRGAAQCLFEGRLAPALTRVSPHIVDLARAPDLLGRWHREGAGRHWGVLMETPLPMHLARRHVRRFMQVRMPDGSGPVLCRCWDPRVLGPLIDHADDGQRARLLPDDVKFLVEGSRGAYRRYGSDRTGFRVVEHPSLAAAVGA